ELESQVLGDGSIDERWSDGVGSEAEVVVSIDGGRPGWIEEAETSDFFFFSSRRRHTRFSRDWSSDVCSSDLHVRAFAKRQGLVAEAMTVLQKQERCPFELLHPRRYAAAQQRIGRRAGEDKRILGNDLSIESFHPGQIGRAHV